MCQSLFFNKVACLRPVTLLEKRLWRKCFPLNFVKFLRTPLLRNTSGQLLLLFGFHSLYQLLHSQVYRNDLNLRISNVGICIDKLRRIK